MTGDQLDELAARLAGDCDYLINQIIYRYCELQFDSIAAFSGDPAMMRDAQANNQRWIDRGAQ
jgi:hypothetical protein